MSKLLYRSSIPAARRCGFTLLEIVLVLALITVLAGITAQLSFNSLFSKLESKPAYEIFREATHEARIQAISESRVVYLSFDESAQEFRLTKSNSAHEVAVEEDDDFGSAAWSFEEEEEPAPDPDAPRTVFPVHDGELKVAFYGILPEDDGPAVFDRDMTEEPLANLVFHSSGISTPAVAVFTYSNGDEERLTLDLLSNGPLLQLSEEDRY